MNTTNTLVYSVTKRFGSFPFAHRAYAHAGHCKQVHGHNWLFDVTFTGPVTAFDPAGFLVDFGGLAQLKDVLTDRFDHTLVLSTNDPLLPMFRALEAASGVKLVLLDEPSSEGIAKLVLNLAQHWVNLYMPTDCGIYVRKVSAFESDKNSATVEAFPSRSV